MVGVDGHQKLANTDLQSDAEPLCYRARETLTVGLTVPLAAPVEGFHLQVSAPGRAHRQKAPPFDGRGSKTHYANERGCASGRIESLLTFTDKYRGRMLANTSEG